MGVALTTLLFTTREIIGTVSVCLSLSQTTWWLPHLTQMRDSVSPPTLASLVMASILFLYPLFLRWFLDQYSILSVSDLRWVLPNVAQLCAMHSDYDYFFKALPRIVLRTTLCFQSPPVEKVIWESWYRYFDNMFCICIKLIVSILFPIFEGHCLESKTFMRIPTHLH